MFAWYIAQPNELLLDLDAFDRAAAGATWGEIYFRRRLRTAIRAKVLRVDRVWLARSSHRPGHFHARIALPYRLPVIERMIWQLHLGSDLYRGRADLMRAARGEPAPSLLIRRETAPRIGDLGRNPDHFCECTEKHRTSEPPDCPIWRQYRGSTPWQMFGPTTQEPADEEPVDLPVGEVPIELIMKGA